MMVSQTTAEEFELQPLGEDLQDDSDLQYLVRSRDNGSISINREPLNEATFERGFRPVKSVMKRNWYKSFIPPEPIRSSLLPPMNKRSCKEFLFIHLPILHWIWTYQYSYIFGDIMSGITVAIMHIPQGLAYASLAGLPPVYGLYASFVPVIVYSVMGTSRHISVGTFAVVSLMVLNTISRVFESDDLYAPCLNDSASEYKIETYNKTCIDISVDVAVTVAFVSGFIMLLMGILQLGFITIFLSESLISGYTTGAAVHVFSSQLKHIFGLTLISQRGFFSVPKTWIEAIRQIFDWPNKVNTATFIISFITITVLIVFRVVDRKLLRKLKVPYCFYSRTTKSCAHAKIRWPIPLPSQLIVVIVVTLISFLAEFHERFKVEIVENIPLGLPPLTVPHSSYISLIIQDAIVIAVVTFSVSVSLSQVFAKQYNYVISPSQEFVAYGIMNIIGSLFGCLNTAGSLSRSTIQAVTGGKTQLVGFLSSTIMLIVLLRIGSLFEPLPNAVLASIIWVALYGMLSQIKDVWRYFKLSVSDMFIWIVVFLATVLLGVDVGLGIGVGFSILVVVVKVILPKSSALGRAKDTEIFRNFENFENVQIFPGVVVYRFQAPLCFINCKVFLSRLDLVCGVDRTVTSSSVTPGCVQAFFNKMCNKKCDSYDVSSHNSHNNVTSHTSVDLSRQNSGGISRSRSFQQALKEDIIDNCFIKKPPPGSIHTLVLDCAPISFMDAMGVKTLKQLVLDFDYHGIQVLFAAMTKHNRDMLERVGFFDKCGKEWLFPSLQDAVSHALVGVKLRPGNGEEQLQVVTSNIDEEENRNASDNTNTVSVDMIDEMLDSPQTNDQ